MSGDGALLDTRFSAETPEGIALALRPAGLAARGWAFAIDLAIRGLLLGTVSAVLGTLGGFGLGAFLIAFFLLDWFYPVVFELLPGAATPGKRALGLRVAMDTGLPVTPAASLLRNLLRAADFMPMAWTAGAICMLLRPDAKRLGDLAAGTLVVHAPPRRAALPAAARPAPAEPREPAVALDARAQAALVAWADRVPSLTPERADELAALAAPAVAPRVPAERRVEWLAGVAAWIVGRRPAAGSR